MVDLSVLKRSDFETYLKLNEIESMRINKDPSVVKIFVLSGAKASRQLYQMKSAAAISIAKFAKQNIRLDFEYLNHDTIFSVLKWTPWEVINYALKSDIHIIPTHLHQGKKNLHMTLFK